MDIPRSHLLTWGYFSQGKTMEELRQSLLYTTVELETFKLQAQEELRKRDDQLVHLTELLNKTVTEREEAQEKCQKLFYEKLLLQQQQFLQSQQKQAGQFSGLSSIEDEPRRGLDSNNGFSSSDCDESIVSSPVIDQILPLQQPQLPPPPPPPAQPAGNPQPPAFHEDRFESLISDDKPLPEKGKLLQAVMKAGPLLQTLLLAGPLPQWRTPPPPLESFEIPPVTVPSPPLHRQDSVINITSCNSSGRVNRKRGFGEGSDSSAETNKYQKIILH